MSDGGRDVDDAPSGTDQEPSGAPQESNEAPGEPTEAGTTPADTGGDEGLGESLPFGKWTRRGLLGSGAVVAVGAFFGLRLAQPATTADPVFPDGLTDGDDWQQFEAEESESTPASLGPIDITVAQSTVQYENVALRQQIGNSLVTVDTPRGTRERPLREYAGGQFDSPIMIFSGTRIDFGPNVDNMPGGLGKAEVLSRIEDRGREQFESQLEDEGLTNVEQTGEDTIDVDTGETATLFEYEATYPIDRFTIEEDGQQVEVPPDELAVAGLVAVWSHGDFVLVSTAAYPDEAYARSFTDTTDGGFEVTVEFDLGLTPDEYSDTLREYVEGVE